jgi:hypothetical protein
MPHPWTAQGLVWRASTPNPDVNRLLVPWKVWKGLRVVGRLVKSLCRGKEIG